MSKQLITPELANEWITSYFYEKSLMHSVMRNIRPGHVEYLAEEMKNGVFGSATIAFADCKENGRRFIVNGNHTLRAIIRSGVTLYLTVEHNECDTMEQVRHLYATYDKNLLRTRADSLRAYRANEIFNITQTDVVTLSAAVLFLMRLFGTNSKKKVADSIILQEMTDWVAPFGQIVAAVGSGNTTWYRRIIRRRAVLSIGLATMRYQRPMAFSFWQSVVTAENLTRYSPALRLRDHLMETALTQEGGNPEELAKVVAYCWSKHYNNERIVQMKVSYDKPVVIVGTPLTQKVKEIPPQIVAQLIPA